MFRHADDVSDDDPERAQIAALVSRIADEAVEAYGRDICQALTGSFDRNERAARLSTLLRAWVDAAMETYEGWQRARDISALDE